MDRTFSALADATRRGILRRLADGDCSLSELAAPFDMTLPAVMKHVGVLERAGLLTHDKRGRVRRCHLEAEPLRDAADWINCYRAFWERQLDSLASYFQQSALNKASRDKSGRRKRGRRKSK